MTRQQLRKGLLEKLGTEAAIWREFSAKNKSSFAKIAMLHQQVRLRELKGLPATVGPVDRSDDVELSEEEAKTVLCIVQGTDKTMTGFLSRNKLVPQQITTMKVVAIKAQLESRGLETEGLKPAVCKRLRDAMIGEYGG